MAGFQRVVVPLSLTSADDGLLRYASLVAGIGVTREFHFVAAVDRTRREALFRADDDVLDELRATVAARFAAGDELSVTCSLLDDGPIDGLLEFVCDRAADLVLVGRARETGSARPWSAWLALIAPCSVWVVPEASAARLSAILAPVDFSDHSAASLSQAAAIACLTELSECLSLHVRNDALGGPRFDPDRDLFHGADARFGSFLKGVNPHGVAILPHSASGPDVAGSIVAFARRHSVDLIVMSGGEPAYSPERPSVLSQALAESSVPILVVRPRAARLHRHPLACQAIAR